MRRILVAMALGALSLLSSGAVFAAPTAVIGVDEEQWYTDNRDTALGGARLTRWYAPLPVFFEGWKSTPRDQIVDYQWDFGDGSAKFHGFNAAHVYETPGSYTCTLTVTDASNATSTATIAITALARTGAPIYYVDSVLGNDSNPGTSQGAGAWKTADKAFSGLTTNTLGPGTQILFNRGQTFDVTAGLVEVSHWKTNSGWLFGAYGTGAKPILKLKDVTGNYNSIIYVNGVGMAHATFEDLVVDCTSNTGQVCDFFFHSAEVYDLLFLRMDIKNMGQGVTLSGGQSDRRQSGIFFVNSTMYNSSAVSNFATSARYALIGNTFDKSGNHVNYLAYCDKGVITGNTFSRAAFGRAALRIDGEPAAYPSNNVEICDNNVVGWIDPIDGFPTTGYDVVGSPHYDPLHAHNGGGTRYNFYLVYLAPNAPVEQVMQDVVFERNTVMNGERFMWIGDYQNLTIRNNTFYSPDASPDAYRFMIGHQFENRPVNNIQFLNNTIVSNEARVGGNPGIFCISNYVGPAYAGWPRHTNIGIKGNTIVMQGAATADRFLYFDTDDALQRAQVFTDNNTIYATTTSNLVQITGTWQAAGTLYSLSGWQTLSTQDTNTTVKIIAQAPVAGTPTVAASTTTTPIAVTYSGVQDLSGTGLKGVYLWAKKGTNAWAKTSLTSTSTSGTFNFVDVSGDDNYYFALQAEDNGGHISAPPSAFGQASTAYAAAATPPPPTDTTAPTAGTLVAPAVDNASPIAVTYSGAADTGGSGLKEVHLWAKAGSGTWADTGLISATASGSFNYTGMTGDGSYSFGLQAFDNSNNSSAAPSGSGQGTTVYDTTAPTAPTITAPGTVTTSPITVTYSGAADSGSGLQKVSLWVKSGSGGTWADSGLSQTTASGSFNYTGMSGDGTYYFAAVALDNAGNSSAAASGSGQGSTLYSSTAPTAASITAPATAKASPIALTYSGAAAGVSGLKKVSLWVKKASGGTWADSGLSQTTASGSFSYTGMSGDATYYFATVSQDNALNQSATPTGNGSGSTIYDTTVPTAATITAPVATGASPIALTYTGAADGGSGLQKVSLWVKKASGGTWADSGLSQTTASGSFSYTGMSGAATYYFATRVQDVAGNLSATPSGSGSANTIYDTTAPTAPTLTAPATSTTTPLTITYTGAADTGGSGLQKVSLWAKKDTGGTWADTGLSQSTAAGSFSYAVPSGDGTYYFATVVLDAAGNTSAAASGSGQSNTIYGTTTPTAATITAPATAKASPIALTYSGASTGGAGLKTVNLWVKKGAGGAWGDSGLSQTTASGSFNYTGMSGDATYFFATRVQDNATNLSAIPTGSGTGSTAYDTTAPTAATVSGSAAVKTSPIALTYSGAADAGSGLKQVNLWFKKGAGAWTDSGLSQTAASGSFSFAGTTGDATYSFATLAVDNAGNQSATPSGAGSVSVALDGTAPTAPSLSSPASTSTTPITVTYSGAADAGSGLKQINLWVKKDSGAWADSGVTATAASGSFSYVVSTGDGTYSFAAVAQDNAGNTSAVPSGAGATSTVFDGTPPTAPTLSSAATVTVSPIAVTYSGAADSGSGLKLVHLWVKKGTGSWADSGLSQSAAAGTFNYTGMTGDASYSFAAVAEDNQGNLSAAASGSGGTTTVFDTTAPVIGTMSSKQSTKNTPVSVSYTGVSDAGSGLKQVNLWVKKDAGAWADSGMTLTTGSGTFNYDMAAGNGTYAFALVAKDNGGNTSVTPTGAGLATTIFDTVAPNKGSATTAAPKSLNGTVYVTASPITVSYSGSSDALSGLKLVHLWVMKAPGTWADTGQTLTTGSGAFDYTGMATDGTYSFTVCAEDNAGNLNSSPSGDGDLTVVYDTTPPTGAVASSPASVGSSPITVNYAGAADSGSGVKQVKLWSRKGAGSWAATSLTSTTASGSFSFTAASDGTYYFATQTTDNAGLVSTAPSGNGDCSTIYDTTAPTAGTLTAPAQKDGPPIAVTYAGVADGAGSGVKTVGLWVKKGAGGTWTNTGQTSATASGSFYYSGMAGNDTYFFALQATDNVGNTSAVPSGSGSASTVYDTSFTPGSAASPAYVTAAPIQVSYSGAQDTANGGLKLVHLWFKKGASGTWADSGLTATGASGTFAFTAVTGDDTYFFGTQAEAVNGAKTLAVQGVGDTATIFDTTLPTPGTITPPQYAKGTPIKVTYTGASDAGSGLKTLTLWVKQGYGGAWTKTALTSTTPDGEFDFTSVAGDNEYFFYIQAEDNAGLKTPDPTDLIVFGTATPAP